MSGVVSSASDSGISNPATCSRTAVTGLKVSRKASVELKVVPYAAELTLKRFVRWVLKGGHGVPRTASMGSLEIMQLSAW